jgi:hypothetical protein
LQQRYSLKQEPVPGQTLGNGYALAFSPVHCPGNSLPLGCCVPCPGIIGKGKPVKHNIISSADFGIFFPFTAYKKHIGFFSKQKSRPAQSPNGYFLAD